MANLYAPIISNDVLLSQIGLRHRRINFDYGYISSFPHQNLPLLRNINWQTIDFNRQSVATLNPVQGVYMFTFNPYQFSVINYNADMIMYIGQATNLLERVSKYFNYVNSKKASDQERRMMILYWGDYLKLNYYQTNNLSNVDLDILEYSLIDSLLPPFNLRIKSEIAQAYRRLINHN